MKELSIEEKAQRYNEALKRAMRLYEQGTITESLSYVFPELQESENEKIRKCIGDVVREYDWSHIFGVTKDDCLAWLEKQGEQKPTDKVEPKSNIEKGKWYVCDTSRYTDFVVGKAYFCPKNGMLKPNENEIARYVAKDCFHLWTIQDAKDGDVLCYKDEISLYKHDIKNCTKQETTFGGFVYYCCYDGKRFVVDSLYSLTEQDKMDIHPATKEQRDTLLKAMADDGYTFDFEKKELKEIHVIDEGKAEMDYCFTKMMNGERVSPAWSEEDEHRINDIIYFLETAKKHYASTVELDACIDWLESLK